MREYGLKIIVIKRIIDRVFVCAGLVYSEISTMALVNFYSLSTNFYVRPSTRLEFENYVHCRAGDKTIYYTTVDIIKDG